MKNARILPLLCLLCLSFAAALPAVLNARPPAVKSIRLSRSEKRGLNIFFSNFAETGLNPFSRGEITDQELVRFGIWHNRWNGNEGWSGKIPASYIHEMAWRYFAKRIRRDQTVKDNAIFRNGTYYVRFGEGDGAPFAQVNGLVTLGNGEFQADVSIFDRENNWDGDIHATPASWRDSSPLDHDKPVYKHSWKAVIKKITEDGKPRYVLLAWQRRS